MGPWSPDECIEPGGDGGGHGAAEAAGGPEAGTKGDFPTEAPAEAGPNYDTHIYQISFQFHKAFKKTCGNPTNGRREGETDGQADIVIS